MGDAGVPLLRSVLVRLGHPRVTIPWAAVAAGETPRRAQELRDGAGAVNG